MRTPSRKLFRNPSVGREDGRIVKPNEMVRPLFDSPFSVPFPTEGDPAEEEMARKTLLGMRH
jgi:hypothetical protein